MYYCIECEKESVKNQKDDFQFKCPFCQQSETLYQLDSEDTEILKGKTIKSVYHNEWCDISRLIIFEDGTHAKIEHPCSDALDIVLLEHDYQDNFEEEFQGDQNNTIIEDIIKELQNEKKK